MNILNARVLICAAGALASLQAQNLTGTVAAADTGAPLSGANVVAVLQSSSPGRQPSIFRSVADSSGRYAISAPPGQYSVCVHPGPQSLYLDPCQWGPPLSVNLGASAASVPLNLQKGVRFILRVHDTKRVLPQAETVAGTAVLVSVASPSAKQLSLPVVFSDGNVRDYGTVVPINAPMSATVSSNKVAISDKTGAALGASPIPFKVLPTDIEVAGAPRNQVTRMFPPPDAKMIHVYATGLK